MIYLDAFDTGFGSVSPQLTLKFMPSAFTLATYEPDIGLLYNRLLFFIPIALKLDYLTLLSFMRRLLEEHPSVRC